MLVRTLCPGGRVDLSLCNGTGTALIASCLEGRMCVGVDSSKRQCEWCRQRLEVFAERELLLLAAMKDGMDPGTRSYERMTEVAKTGTLPNPQVSYRAGDVDVLVAADGSQPMLCVRSSRHRFHARLLSWGLRVRDRACAPHLRPALEHHSGAVEGQCAAPYKITACHKCTGNCRR